ncbi:reverse transcriptase domain-containing protein [Tanacetum coccineum]|uniref:Reverse transcriptase domain-containing protein n=1 Tax=Tanacetum coccineum TaxID=301880 RepID=A0ABQ5HSV4_9ASTR
MSSISGSNNLFNSTHDVLSLSSVGSVELNLSLTKLHSLSNSSSDNSFSSSVDCSSLVFCLLDPSWSSAVSTVLLELPVDILGTNQSLFMGTKSFTLFIVVSNSSLILSKEIGYKSIERDRLMVIEVMVAMDISLCSHFSDNENDVACRDLEAAFEYPEVLLRTIFPIGLKRYRDPKDEPIEKEPLMELKEIGCIIIERCSLGRLEDSYQRFIANSSKVAKPLASLTQKIQKYEWVKEQEEAFQTLKDNLCDTPILPVEKRDSKMPRGLDQQLMERKEGGGMYLLWVSLIGDVRTLMIDEAHASRYLVHSGADKTYYDLRDMYGGHVWRRILLPICIFGKKGKVGTKTERTMEELTHAPTEGYGEAIVLPEINADHFEIKTNLLQLVQANPFYGRESENPHAHINSFKRITSTLRFRMMNVTSSKTDERIDKLADQLSTLIEIVSKKVVTPALVKAVEESYVTCDLRRVFVKVGKFHFPIDFVVVDLEADPRVPLILGRSFLRTDRALIDVYGEEITLWVDNEAVTFNLDQTTRYSSTNDKSVNRIDIIDAVCEEYALEFLGFPNSSSGNPTPTSEPFTFEFILEEIEAYLKDDLILPEIDHAGCNPGKIFV